MPTSTTTKPNRTPTATATAPAAKPPAAPAAAKSAKTALPAQAEIAKRAYEIFLSRGQAPGRELDDWAQAERELSARK